MTGSSSPVTAPRIFRGRQVSGRRTFEEIVMQLERAIVSSDLAAGDRLPPERELAARFEVSRTSVREALRVLEALGLVRVRRGSDNGATLLDRPDNALEPLFRFHLALRHVSVEDLVEFRTVIESWTVQAAAGLQLGDHLRDADEALTRAEAEDLDPSSFLALDLEFHLALARAAGNPFAPLVLEASRSAIGNAMLEGALRVRDWPSIRKRLSQEHRAILHAVVKGKGPTASRLMSRHIGRFYEEYSAVAAADTES
jgi:GntR family transcriptional regulator, transcriptional repressor for pyruvate dehydrogenase complex